MSGHNKWSSIKHQKGAADAKRGQLFTKLTREIIMSAREGGGNPEGNFRLRLAIQKARDANMPLDNIDRAIKKGTGETEGAALAEITVEGYGPSGAAILVQAVSDNRNRTVQEIRNIFTRHGGTMGDAGSVSWMFDTQGTITVETNGKNSEDIELQAIDAGADDVETVDGAIEIHTKPDQIEAVRKALEKNNVPVSGVEVAKVATTTIELDEKASLQALKLLNKLEELDDVSFVSSNVNFSDEVLAKYQEQAS